MPLCWAFSLENESQQQHHCRLHSCQGCNAQTESSCSFKTCMCRIRDGQLSLSPLKAIWRGGKRYISCHGDGNAYCCVILCTAIPQFCQGLLEQEFLLLVHKVALVWQTVQSLGPSRVFHYNSCVNCGRARTEIRVKDKRGAWFSCA